MNRGLLFVLSSVALLGCTNGTAQRTAFIEQFNKNANGNCTASAADEAKTQLSIACPKAPKAKVKDVIEGAGGCTAVKAIGFAKIQLTGADGTLTADIASGSCDYK